MDERMPDQCVYELLTSIPLSEYIKRRICHSMYANLPEWPSVFTIKDGDLFWANGEAIGWDAEVLVKPYLLACYDRGPHNAIATNEKGEVRVVRSVSCAQ